VLPLFVIVPLHFSWSGDGTALTEQSSLGNNGYDAKFTTHVFREVFAPAEPFFH